MRSQALGRIEVEDSGDAVGVADLVLGGARPGSPLVVVGLSNRHVHLAAGDFRTLFGRAELTRVKELRQVGEFVSGETVTIRGPKGGIERVRVLGPFRSRSQCEVSRTDCRTLGIVAPVLDSGRLDEAAPITIEGPAGNVHLAHGAMVAGRHIHVGVSEARAFGVTDGQRVGVRFAGPRGGVLEGFLVRVGPSFASEIHIDTDEGNALDVSSGAQGRILRR